jgi:hypothetical protein
MARKPKKHRGIFERPASSGVWWICYFDQFGRKHREKVGMKRSAIAAYQKRKTEIREGTITLPLRLASEYIKLRKAR